MQKNEAGHEGGGEEVPNLRRARPQRPSDPIFAALVADMDRQPYLYLKTAPHPRDYNPDA